MIPQHRQDWTHDNVRYRILTVTTPGSVPANVAKDGYSMEVDVFGVEPPSKVQLYREVTPPGKKPRPWAGSTPEKSATTYLSDSQEPWVIFYPYDEERWWGLPLREFVETLEYITPTAPPPT